MGLGRIGIEVVAAEIPTLGDQLGGDALVDESVRVARAHSWRHRRRSGERRAERHAAHRLDPSDEHDVVGAGGDALRGEVHSLLARAALPVDCRGRHALIEPRGEHGLPRNVHGLFADLAHATEQYIVDLSGLEPVALEHRLQHVRCQIDRVDARQHPTGLAPADRSSDDVDEDGFIALRHGISPAVSPPPPPAAPARRSPQCPARTPRCAAHPVRCTPTAGGSARWKPVVRGCARSTR